MNRPINSEPRCFTQERGVTLSLNKLPKEVLDESRKDPSMPKSALIVIAQKKQERSMWSTYAKYKTRLNPQKKTRTGGKTTTAQSTFNAMDATESKITALDLQTLSPEEKGSVVTALKGLKQTIEDVMAAALQPASEAGDGSQAEPPEKPKPSKNLA